jgi:IS5 family transposase
LAHADPSTDTQDANIPPPLATEEQYSFATMCRDGEMERATPRQSFLDAAAELLPWPRLYATIQPHYHRPVGRGRPAVPLETMVRLYLVRTWWQLDDAGAEALAWDCPLVRAFCRIDLMKRRPPSARTLERFGALLRQHDVDLATEANRALLAHTLAIDPGKLVEPAMVPPVLSARARGLER